MRGLAIALAFVAAWIMLDWLAVITGPALGIAILIGFLALCIWAIVRLGKLNG
jgi:hypothetical protein